MPKHSTTHHLTGDDAFRIINAEDLSQGFILGHLLGAITKNGQATPADLAKALLVARHFKADDPEDAA